MYTILLVAHTLLVLFLIGMILVQRSDSDGLGGLGGGGGNQFMTGRGAANFMTRATAVLAGAFMLTSVLLAVMANHVNSRSIIDVVPAEDVAVPENTHKDAEKNAKEAPATQEKTAPAAPKPE
jgi:preprotein translocase subunit SecG